MNADTRKSAKRAVMAQGVIATGLLQQLKEIIYSGSKRFIYGMRSEDRTTLASAEMVVFELAASSDKCRVQLLNAGLLHVRLPPLLPSRIYEVSISLIL